VHGRTSTETNAHSVGDVTGGMATSRFLREVLG